MTKTAQVTDEAKPAAPKKSNSEKLAEAMAAQTAISQPANVSTGRFDVAETGAEIIARLEAENAQLKNEMAAFKQMLDQITRETESQLSTSGEARGIVWCDLYKVYNQPVGEGQPPRTRVMKKSVTARSYISVMEANIALSALVKLEAANGWYPFAPTN